MSRFLALTDISLQDKIKLNNEHKTIDLENKLQTHMHTHTYIHIYINEALKVLQTYKMFRFCWQFIPRIYDSLTKKETFCIESVLCIFQE